MQAGRVFFKSPLSPHHPGGAAHYLAVEDSCQMAGGHGVCVTVLRRGIREMPSPSGRGSG
jgi:hypothetical protein